MNTREMLDAAGRKVLTNTKTELCLSMRFLSGPLDCLSYRMDLRTRSVGTDASEILFNPAYLLNLFIDDPIGLRRLYLHVLIHCLFRHMFSAPAHKDAKLWDLACDIAAESVTDSLGGDCIERVPSDFREGWYRRLEEDCGLITAEKVYGYFTDHPADAYLREALTKEFHRCDHAFWEREEKKDDTPPPKEQPMPRRPSAEDWEKEAKRVRTELETFGKEAETGGDAFARLLRYTLTERPLYAEFLRKFTVLRETAEIDPDSFDYGFYHYGIELYGNMPLIEENEYREVRKVEELVIAIDTSASCQEKLVQEFLNETAAVLTAQQSFFRTVRIRILQCDERIRQDTLITRPEEIEKYAGSFAVRGGCGTDFRPVFEYVETLRQRGELRDLKGLIYFTDGFGIFPEKATDYETAFVFRKDEVFKDQGVPDWALKLYL